MGEPGVSIARCNRIALQQWVHMCTACPFSTIVQAPFEIHRQCAATWCISFSSWSPWDRGDSSEPFATKQKFCLKEYSNSDGNFIFQRALGLVPKQLLLFNNLWLRKDDKRNPWDMSNPCWTWQTDWCHSGELSQGCPPQWAVQLKMLSNDVLPPNDNGLHGASLMMCVTL